MAPATNGGLYNAFPRARTSLRVFMIIISFRCTAVHVPSPRRPKLSCSLPNQRNSEYFDGLRKLHSAFQHFPYDGCPRCRWLILHNSSRECPIMRRGVRRGGYRAWQNSPCQMEQVNTSSVDSTARWGYSISNEPLIRVGFRPLEMTWIDLFNCYTIVIVDYLANAHLYNALSDLQTHSMLILI